MRTGVVIQARCGSTRLPNKVLLSIGGRPMFQRVVERVDQMHGIDSVVLATTGKPEDEPLIELAMKLGLSVYCGSENDVLDRYYQAAKMFRLDPIVRITADCPLLDPTISTKVLRYYQHNVFDYCSNAYPVATYPDGLDTEVFSFYALEKAHFDCKDTKQREHVTPYIWKNPEKFKLGMLQHNQDLSHIRWTCDTIEDLNYVREIYHIFGEEPFGMMDILQRTLTPHTSTRRNAV